MRASPFVREVTTIVGRTFPERLAAAVTALSDRSVPFRLDLAADCLPSGELRDFHSTSPLPFVDLPALLLEDTRREAGSAPSPEDLDVATRLGEAAAIAGISVLLSERIEGGPSHYEPEDAPLLAALVAAAAECLAAAGNSLPLGTLSSLWSRHGASLRAERLSSGGRLAVAEKIPGDDVKGLGDRWAPVIAPALSAARRRLDEPLATAMFEACDLFELGRELGSLSVDLSRGAATLPIRRLSARAGLGSSRRFDATALLLVALATPVLPDLAREGRARVTHLRASLVELGLHGVADALARLDDPFASFCALFDGAAATSANPDAEAFTMLPEPRLSRAAHAARDFIAAQPDCADGWEVNRWELFGRPRLTGKVFARGLVLASQVAAGDDCRAEISALLADYARGGFNYYVEGSPLPPDVDTFGLMLRLTSSSADPAAARRLLAPVLRRFVANLDDDGSFPIFLLRHSDEEGDRDRFRDTQFDGAFVGQRCVVAQAGLLLGLLHYALESREDLERIELPLPPLARAVRGTLRRFVELGELSSTYYATAFTCDAMLMLCDALRGEHGRIFTGVDEFEREVARATEQAVALLERRLARGALGPQDLSLIYRATGSAPAMHLRDPRWLDRILRVQRYDGAWDGEPLYVVPTQGNRIDWHQSKLLTTAVVYSVVGAEARSATGTVRKEPT